MAARFNVKGASTPTLILFGKKIFARRFHKGRNLQRAQATRLSA
jgi:hypothetical protein